MERTCADMAGRVEWMIYGANGYTGRLVVAEANQRERTRAPVRSTGWSAEG